MSQKKQKIRCPACYEKKGQENKNLVPPYENCAACGGSGWIEIIVDSESGNSSDRIYKNKVGL